MRRILSHALWLAATLLFTFGCGDRPAGEGGANPNQTGSASSHSHGSGPHQGAIANWGGGKYHVEFTVDHDVQQATIYILADDAATPAPIEADKLLLNIREPQFQVELAAVPLNGEPPKASSRFLGKHESLGIVREFAGTITGEINGTPYAGQFSEQAE